MKVIYLRPQKDPENKVFVWFAVMAALMAPAFYLFNPNLEFIDLFTSTSGKGWFANLFFLFAFIIGLRQINRKQAEMLSTEVEIRDQTITLPKSPSGKVELHREEIVAVVDDGRGLAIQVKDDSTVLNLGPEIYTGDKNYEAIRATLTAWAPEGHPKRLFEPELKQIGSSAAKGMLPLLAAIVVTLLFNSIWVEVPVLVLIAGYLVISTLRVWRKLDAKSKSFYINTLVIVNAFILIRLFIVFKLNP